MTIAAAPHFVQPDVQIGEMVYWYYDPTSLADPCFGWICRRPGTSTVSVLVFTPDTGFQEKPSVRHKDDPGLVDNIGWRQWGCWDYSPTAKQMARISEISSSMALNHERETKRQQNGAK